MTALAGFPKVLRPLAAAVTAVWIAGCTSSGGPAPGGDRARPPSAIEISAAIARGEAVLVDVREEGEVMGGMAEPARWMPTSLIRDGQPDWERFVASLPESGQVALYCVSGVRSGRAAGMLRRRGFRAHNLGGLGQWTTAGLPVRKPERLTVGR